MFININWKGTNPKYIEKKILFVSRIFDYLNNFRITKLKELFLINYLYFKIK